MALKERPAGWHFVVSLPEARDTRTQLSQEWTLTLDQAISRGHQEFPLTRPLKVTADTRRIPDGAVVFICIETEVATECRRCCSPLTVAIRENFMYSYILQTESAGAPDNGEKFCDSEDVVIPVTWLGNTLDITDQVWECLVVSLPDYAECPGGCAEIETLIPAEDRRDPRFQVLADLLKDEKDKGGE